MEFVISFLLGVTIGWFTHPKPTIVPKLTVYKEVNDTFDWRFKDEGERVSLTKNNFQNNVTRSIKVKAAYSKCTMQTKIYNEVMHGDK